MSVTEVLKQARIAQKKSVLEVADAAQLHENTIRCAERTGGVSVKTLTPWAAALGYQLVLMPSDVKILMTSGREEAPRSFAKEKSPQQ